MAAAATAGKNAPVLPFGLGDLMPPKYFHAVLADAAADTRPAAYPIQKQRLSDIARHLLRVACSRCGRTVEIQTVDAIRLYGLDANWKDVGQRLLDNTCTQRTGRLEEDGCWPRFD